MGLSDYGARYVLETIFENATEFEVALFLSGTPDDTPVLEEVETQDYDRAVVSGATGGAFEYQTYAGATSVVDTGIAAYKFVNDIASDPLEWVFAGPLSSVNKSIIGYALLKPGTWSNPFPADAVLDSKLLDTPFTPVNDGDTLIINSINIRLSKGTVS